MNHWKLVIAVVGPVLLAVGGWLLLRHSGERDGPPLAVPGPGTGTTRITAGTSYDGPVPKEQWPKVEVPRGGVPDTPRTRPTPEGDEGEVLDLEKLEALLEAGDWEKIRELLRIGILENPAELATRIVSALGEGGNDSLHAVQALLTFRDDDVRSLAAERLVTLANATTDDHVLRAAFEAMGQLGDGSVVESLEGFARRLTDRNTTVQALYAIAEIGSPESAAALARLLREKQGTGLEDVLVTSIGRVGSAEMVEALRPLLDASSTRELRLDAARALARTGSPAAMPALTVLLENDSDRDLRKIALEGLGRMGTRESVETLLRIREAGGDLSFEAGLALGAARGPEAERAILARIDSESDDRVRVRMIQALEDGALPETREKLVKYLNSSEESSIVREYSARMLGRSGKPEAVAPLATALSGATRDEHGLRRSLLHSLFQLVRVPGAMEELKEKALPVLNKMAEEEIDDQERFWLERTRSVIRPR